MVFSLRNRQSLLALLAALSLFGAGVCASAQVRLEDFSQRLGPFEVGAQRFSVVLQKKRVAGGADPDTHETIARVEIRDAAGLLHYEQTLPYRLVGNAFQFTIDASAERLQGTRNTGLLLSYGSLPSPPLGGQAWQVFGLFDGKLVPFSKPISFDGQLMLERTANGVAKTASEPNFQPEVLRGKLWSGNFFVIVPLRVDWLPAKMSPAWRCSKLTAKGPRAVCEYRVEADRIATGDALTFVRLFPEADEGFTPEHVVVKPDSKVEFLAAEAEIVWNDGPEEANLSVAEDPWLKVRIDGKEGWIHTQEDFDAIGLPQTN